MPDQQTIHDALRWRYATKAFDPERRIDEGTWAELEHALSMAPSSYGLEPWRFVVITDPTLRAELKPKAFGQNQIVDASHLVVICAKTDLDAADVDAFIARTAAARDQDAKDLAGYRDVIVGDLVHGPRSQMLEQWAQRQCYIALGFFLETAALLGIDACPMEGFDPQAFDEELAIPGYRPVVLITAGYRSSQDRYAEAAKVRLDPQDAFIRR